MCRASLEYVPVSLRSLSVSHMSLRPVSLRSLYRLFLFIDTHIDSFCLYVSVSLRSLSVYQIVSRVFMCHVSRGLGVRERERDRDITWRHGDLEI